MKIVAVIPARYQSSRLPGKPLAEIAGEPMIRWVYERTRKAHFIDEVWVATDDERIHKTVISFGGNSRMTSSEHQSGTDRVAEIARHMDWDLVINVQGDEPLIDPDMINEVILCFKNNSSVYMGTLKRAITTTDEVLNPNVVKVVTDNEGYALYFSRSPLPFGRTFWNTIQEIEHAPLSFPVFKHIGVYGYTKDFLLQFASLKPTSLEKIEHLEQLRALEHGYKIKVGITDKNSFGVDHPDDLQRVRNLVKQQRLSFNVS